MARGGVSDQGGSEPAAPSDLYELLGVEPGAEGRDIKSAYYDKMKLCHPDVAGEEGVEMCVVLNDAYDVLSNPEERDVYDEQMRSSGQITVWKEPEQDTGPTWTWSPTRRNHNDRPSWDGRPLSRSLWDRLTPEERGEKWEKEMFVFVDEWSCIACRNCCDTAPKTFCIDAAAGRARVYSQWGNDEESLDYAVASCPVDCIYWVNREELESLEYVTREKMWEIGSEPPCSMAVRQGARPPGMIDIFEMAASFSRSVEDKADRQRKKLLENRFLESAVKVQERIQAAFRRLSSSLRKAGWG